MIRVIPILLWCGTILIKQQQTKTKKKKDGKLLQIVCQKIYNNNFFFLHTSPYNPIRHNITHIFTGKSLFKFNIFVMKEQNEQSTVCYKLKFRLLLLIVLNCCVKLRNETVISINKNLSRRRQYSYSIMFKIYL